MAQHHTRPQGRSTANELLYQPNSSHSHSPNHVFLLTSVDPVDVGVFFQEVLQSGSGSIHILTDPLWNQNPAGLIPSFNLVKPPSTKYSTKNSLSQLILIIFVLVSDSWKWVKKKPQNNNNWIKTKKKNKHTEFWQIYKKKLLCGICSICISVFVHFCIKMEPPQVCSVWSWWLSRFSHVGDQGPQRYMYVHLMTIWSPNDKHTHLQSNTYWNCSQRMNDLPTTTEQ